MQAVRHLSRTAAVRTAVSSPYSLLFARAMSSAGLTFAKYPFLKNLGLSENNAGVYNGKFEAGKGPVFTSVNPATNEPIATVSTGTKEQLEVGTRTQGQHCAENEGEQTAL